MLLSLVAYVSDYHVKSLTLRIYLYYSSKNTSIPLKWGKMSSIFNSLLKKINVWHMVIAAMINDKRGV